MKIDSIYFVLFIISFFNVKFKLKKDDFKVNTCGIKKLPHGMKIGDGTDK